MRGGGGVGVGLVCGGDLRRGGGLAQLRGGVIAQALAQFGQIARLAEYAPVAVFDAEIHEAVRRQVFRTEGFDGQRQAHTRLHKLLQGAQQGLRVGKFAVRTGDEEGFGALF